MKIEWYLGIVFVFSPRQKQTIFLKVINHIFKFMRKSKLILFVRRVLFNSVLFYRIETKGVDVIQLEK